MPAKPDATAARRTRLTTARESEILKATLELLEEVGYQGLTMPAVASRARCSTATIYRQWQGKSGLVIAALEAHRSGPPPGPDTGTLRGDLVAMISDVPNIAESELALMAALAHASLRDESLAEAMRIELSGAAKSPLDHAIDRAVARGDINPTDEVRRYAHHILLSIAMARHLIEGQRPDLEYLTRFVDCVLLPVLQAPASDAS
ncbi:TetR/AcrR family transcriptional regulator [Pseudolysinimonas yzui]|uniref:TetR family transcriptional regulator n=1 Tax=Pseudolysinimonas yzui TaxID=2708254 RepID=A0A8J3GN11_9MICO|nr:TetR/AcrR family transcriptional regulator [Pseudolysinimonas yzui]GHF05344.1 TetR family transcriptional regulator [Pseudolysinimonas yzui]